MNNTVIIDTNKLYSELSAQNKTKSGFSLEIGRGKSYIENLKRSPIIPEGMERVISIMLGKEAGFFIERQEGPKQDDISGKEAQILVNITVRLKELSKKTRHDTREAVRDGRERRKGVQQSTRKHVTDRIDKR